MKQKKHLPRLVGQEHDPRALWIIFSHRSGGGEVEIARRLAASSADAPRIAALLLCTQEQLEHGTILRVLKTNPSGVVLTWKD